jgi:hypothetical protein
MRSTPSGVCSSSPSGSSTSVPTTVTLTWRYGRGIEAGHSNRPRRGSPGQRLGDGRVVDGGEEHEVSAACVARLDVRIGRELRV